MTKLKNALILLLVALLLAAGAVLPTAATRVQDALAVGQVQYADVESLQLTLAERRQQLSIQEKLHLITSGTGVEVTGEVTQMNGAQVLEALYAQLENYASFGLFAELDNDLLEFYPVMVYDDADPDRYCFYWWVNMSFDAGAYDQLTAILDDETGKLLALEYVDPDLHIPEKVLWEYQDALQAIYFGNLELEPVAAMKVDNEGILSDAMETVNTAGDSHVVICYQLVDTLYGEVNIEICVHTNGFYITLVG